MLIQVVWLVASFAVPLWFMARRNGDGLLLWIVLATCTDVVNVRSVINVTATSVAGLLLVPYSAGVLVRERRAAAVSWAVAHLGYLVVLGLVFGLAFAWPDPIGRPFNLQAPGRTLLYLMRETASLSIAVFVGQQVAKARQPDRLLAMVLWTTIVTAAFALLEYATGISYYLLLSEGAFAPTYHNFRVRGLNFEPRGLGLVVAHAVVISVAWLAVRRHVRFALGTLASALPGAFLSASTSGLIAAGAGTGTLALSSRRIRRYLVRLAMLAVVAGAVTAAIPSDAVGRWQYLVTERVGSTQRFGDARGVFEEVVYRMEVYDTAAALFLAANPVYFFIGTGPGLVTLPATPFLPLSAYTQELAISGVNSPPTMGWLLELANGGVIGALLWLGFVVAAARSLGRLAAAGIGDGPAWAPAKWIFLASAVIYLFSAGFLSSCWALFVGLGLGASFLSTRLGSGGEPSHAT